MSVESIFKQNTEIASFQVTIDLLDRKNLKVATA